MKETLNLFSDIVTELLDDEADRPVSNYIPSDQLFDTLDISLGKDPLDKASFIQSLKEVILASPRTATNSFFNQLFGGRNEKAILGELLSVILNNSMYTYKAAGPQIGIEKEIIKNICDLIGWGANSGGTFAAGGSMTNFMSLLMARDAHDDSIRYKGVSPRLTIYTSASSHYSIYKNASFCGIGRQNVRHIPTDHYGKMNVLILEETIKKDITEGFQPVLVNATMGTTVLGAIDPIRAISEVCKNNDIWLHVDGAYLGSVIFSQRYKHLSDGLSTVDSFSVNAHKMIGTPLSCSMIVVRDNRYLYQSFAQDASYLYQTDQDGFNPGLTSLQCGRRNDALKFWTLWKSVGTRGLENIVNTQFVLADVARQYITDHPDYTLYSYKDSISVCFNYKNISAKAICTALYEHSTLMVGYGSFADQEFIRLVTINAQNKKDDIINFFKILEEFVQENMHST